MRFVDMATMEMPNIKMAMGSTRNIKVLGEFIFLHEFTHLFCQRLYLQIIEYAIAYF